MKPITKIQKLAKAGFKPGELLKARAKMSADYIAKEKTEKKDPKKESKESKVHEKAEHLTKKQVAILKKKKK